MRLSVRVHPRATRVRRAWDGKLLELWIRQPPFDGAANEAMIAEVAHWLGIPRRSVHIVSGHTSRLKLLAIDGPVTLPPPDTGS